MKLLRLKINSPFNSLSNKGKKSFELNFREPFYESESSSWESFHPFCFAGLNGSGKSNVLEALANIFFHLENCTNTKQPKSFLDNFNPEVCSPDAFELEYCIVPNSKFDALDTLYVDEIESVATNIKKSDYNTDNLIKILITKDKGKRPEFYGRNLKTDEIIISSSSIDEEGKKQYNFKIVKDFLPDIVVGYSSGENEVLSIPFLKSRLISYDEYCDSIPDVKYFKPENSLVYIDYEMSQAVLLSNFLYQDAKVVKPLEEELGIKDVKRFRMGVHLHKIEKLYKNKRENYELLSQYEETITLFKNCSTSFYEDDERLVLDFFVNDNTKEAFRANFKSTFELFQSFQVLYMLNYRILSPELKKDVYQSKGYYTDWKLPSPSPTEKVFSFSHCDIEKIIGKEKTMTKKLVLKNLSDGEQQFLHSLGICLMLKGKSALLLLDEPETHFNPDWRSKFISTLKVCLEASGSNNLMRDILITSHSPFIISDCFPDKVIIFKRGEQPENAKKANFRTFGTSVDIIMENIFKKNNTIGDFSRLEIEKIQKEIEGVSILSKKQVKNYKNQTNHLGDSMEKILLFAQLNQLEKK